MRRLVTCLALVTCACHPLSLFAPSALPASLGTKGGVGANVEVLLDGRGVPHVYGQTESDLAYGLGFMHGRDRRFQLVLLTHAAEGRLTELFGKDLLSTDRQLRLVSWKLDEQVAALDPRDRRLLDAYVAGVNAGEVQAGRTSEMVLLGLEQTPFTVRDSVAIARLQTWQLAGDFEDELVRDAVLAALKSDDPRRPLFDAPVPTGGVPIVASQGVPQASSDRALSTPGPLALGPEQRSPKALAVLQRLGLLTHGASNSWAVSGAKTASGKAVVCNDPHLDHSWPSVFYLAHLEAPDFTVAGITFPGVPAVLIGFTRHLAWGMTASLADTQDLLRVTPQEPRQDVTQTFKLGKQADASVITETWQGTRFGPMVPPAYVELAPRAKDYALSWGPFNPPDSARLASSFFDLAKARDLPQAEAALENASAAGQNVTLGFVDGTIAYRLTALIAARPAGATGRLPREAAEGGPWLTVPQRPSLTNPPAGYLVTANQRIVDDGDALVGAVGTYGDHPWRALRIHERLDALLAQKKPTADELLQVQGDVLSAAAREEVPVLGAACPEALEGHPPALVHAFCEAVRHFDGTFRETSLGALPYALLLRQLRLEVVKSLGTTNEVAWRVAGSEALVAAVTRGLREGPGSALFGGDLRAFLVPVAKVVLTQLVDKLGDDPKHWRYGLRHRLTFASPMADAPLVGWLYKTDTFEVSGAASTVHAEGGLPVSSGSVLRMVVELTDPPTARLTIDTGQSGTPGTPHAFDQFPAWNSFAPPPFPVTRAEVEAQVEARVLLVP